MDREMPWMKTTKASGEFFKRKGEIAWEFVMVWRMVRKKEFNASIEDSLGSILVQGDKGR